MKLSEDRHYNGLEVAIIGMAGQFPGASNIKQYWDNIVNGIDSITRHSDQDLRVMDVEEHLIADPRYVKANGLITGKHSFDADFFKYSGAEAQIMDPQIRLMHENVWNALEDAGYPPDVFTGRIGLYIGASSSTFWESHSYLSGKYDKLGEFSSSFLANKDFAATQIAYKLNLRGPSVMLQSACSTSLVAVHSASHALLTQDCDIALAGGVSIGLTNRRGYLHEEGMVFSSDGYCRAFDEQADGTVPGDGIGVVVLKLLERAIQDGDHIYAVIKGAAVNNDGNAKVGFTAPGVAGQSEVIRNAIEMAEISPESIGYIEAHGTGTALGDVVEVESLCQVFEAKKMEPIALASVKTNVGHLDSASGIAGLIKAALSIKYEKIPKNLHFKRPNPKLNLDSSPFYVPTKTINWSRKGPRRAGVSSFGIGGTNAHVILEDSPINSRNNRGTDDDKLIILSAKTSTALERKKEELSTFLREQNKVCLTDLSFTLQRGRSQHAFRWFTVISNQEELIRRLLDRESGFTYTYEANEMKPIVFMFPGQGLQYPGMGRSLYNGEESFRIEMDRCFAVLDDPEHLRIKHIILSSAEEHEDAAFLNTIDVAPIVTFIMEYCMARFLMKKGIKPDCLIGHSVGEYAAACISEALSLRDGLRLVALRGRLMKQMPEGIMVSVPMSAEEIEPIMQQFSLSLAADHGASCIIAGDKSSMEHFEQELRKRKMITQRLPISHAGHSAMMDNIVQSLLDEVRTVSFAKQQISIFSSRTGSRITDSELADPYHWANHMNATVRFAEGIRSIIGDYKNPVFMEIGPGNSLCRIVKQLNTSIKAVPTMKNQHQPITDIIFWKVGVGLSWLFGGNIQWDKMNDGESFNRISLPGYPFERTEFPFNIKLPVTAQKNQQGRRSNMSDWFYVPAWKQSVLHTSDTSLPNGYRVWLINNSEMNIELLSVQQDEWMITVRSGESFLRSGKNDYVINAAEQDDYVSLFQSLVADGIVPSQVVVLWSIGLHKEPQIVTSETFDKLQVLGMSCLLNLSTAWNESYPSQQLGIVYVSNNVHALPGYPSIQPELATIIGPLQVIPTEYPNIRCQHVDISLIQAGPSDMVRVAEQLKKELNESSDDSIVCYRGKSRLIRSFDSVRVEDSDLTGLLKDDGVYVVTGGLGGIGFTLCKEIASVVQRPTIVILQRNPFSDNANDQVNYLEQLGACVTRYAVDLADASEMMRIRADISLIGEIRGIVHCAGTSDGALIHNLDESHVHQMFAPKVYGTINLDRLTEGHSLDFIMYCSSLNAHMSTIGTAVYTAANSFLDAYSSHLSAARNIRVLSINWFAWREVGGAVKNVERMIQGIAATSVPFEHHPLIHKQMLNKNERIYISNLNPAEQWVLNEHVVNGKPMLPGTAYLEIIAGIVRELLGSSVYEILDCYLLQPLISDISIDLYTTVNEVGKSEYEFHMWSRSDNKSSQHASGKFRAVNLSNLYMTNVLKVPAIESTESTRSKHVQFGPRWIRNIRGVLESESGTAIRLKLPEAYRNEVESYCMHPGLLDTALATVHGEGLFPFYYKRIVVRDNLPYDIFSTIKLIENLNDKAQVYDYIISDANGRVILEVENYTLVKSGVSVQDRFLISKGPDKQNTDIIDKALEDALTPEEGAEIFRRLLASGLEHVVTCPIDLEMQLNRRNNEEEFIQNNNRTLISKRPELSTPFVSPKTKLESAVAEVWKNILSIESVGIHDNFFDLGATSLTLIQVNKAVQTELGRSIPIVTYYMYPSIRQLVEHLTDSHPSGSVIEKQAKVQSKLGARRKRMGK